MKYKKYPSYKDSGVEWLGRIPSEWIGSTLKYHSYIYNGNSISDTEKEQYENLETITSIPYISTKDIDSSFLTINYDNGMRVSKAAEKFKKAKKDTTLLCIEGGSAGKKLAFLKEDVCFVNKLACIDSYNGLDRKFSHYITRSTIFKYSFNLATTGLIPGVSINQLKDFNILLPSLQEQQQIANFLDTATAKMDTLIGKQKSLIELLKEKRQAVISHAVTKGLNPHAKMKDSGVEWLGEVPEHWVTPKLKLFIKTTKGFAFKSDDFIEEGIPVVKMSEIKNGTINPSTVFLPEKFQFTHKEVLLRHKDIIVSTVGSAPEVKNSAVGQVGIVPAIHEGSLLNQNTVVYSPNKKRLSNSYLPYILKSQAYREHLDLHAHGTANQASLNLSDMLKFVFPCPLLQEQEAIAKYLDDKTSKIDSLVSKATKSIELLKEKRTALISSAVTGKIDVREIA